MECGCVAVPPRLAPVMFPNETLAGMRAQASCFVQEGDQPLTLTWLKDGQPLEEGHGVRTSLLDTYTSILVIENTAAHDSAKYTCVASNPARTIRSSATLSVSGTVSSFLHRHFIQNVSFVRKKLLS